MTNQMQSGPTEFLPVGKINEEWQAVKDFSDKYLQQLRLVSKMPEEIDEILSLSKEQRSRLSPSTCFEYASILSTAALYIQQEHNLHTLCLNWSERRLLNGLSKEYDQYDKFTPFEIKKYQFINSNNEYAKELYKLYSLAKNRIDTLQDIHKQLGFMASIYKDLGHAKGRYES